MEDRNMREVKLDLLKTLTSDALLRKVAVQDRSDRPWRTLVQALRQVMPEAAITEADVRRRVIEVYSQELSLGTPQLLEAKLNDELSYFNRAGYTSVLDMKEHFPWYLCCLTYEEDQFESGKLLRKMPGHFTEEHHKLDISAVSSSFSVSFQLHARVCFHDVDKAGGAVVFEATNESGRPVLQLVMGSGDKRGRLVARIQTKSGYGKSGKKEPIFVEKPGFISKNADILKMTMTVAAAKKKAATLPNCRGFSFKGPDVGQPLEIFFKNRFEIKVEQYDPYGARVVAFPGEWKSFKLEDGGLQEWLVSDPLESKVWQDVALVKGARFLSVEVEGKRRQWSSDDNSDPFYSEVSLCDTLHIGASGLGGNKVKEKSGWLAEIEVKLGELRRHPPPSDMIRMPLDKVDLQTVATCFQTDIMVYHLLERPWSFSVSPEHRLGRCVRLLRYVDLWSAMADKRTFEDEPLALTGAVVKLGDDLPGLLQPVSLRAATILGYEVQHDGYRACIDQVQFMLRRDQITRVIYHESNSYGMNDMFSEDEGPEMLRHLPTKSYEFYLLGRIIIKLACDRLQSDHLTVKGVIAPGGSTKTISMVAQVGQSRPALAPIPCNATKALCQGSSSSQQVEGSNGGGGSSSQLGAQGFIASSSPYPPVLATAACTSSSSPCAVYPCATNGQTSKSASSQMRRVPIEVAREEVKAGRQLMLTAVDKFDVFDAGQLQLKPLDQVSVVEFKSHWAKCKYTRREAFAAWCPVFCLTLWRVDKAFRPDPKQIDKRLYDECLPLERGQDVLVRQELEIQRTSWGRGRLYSADGQLAGREGIFPLDNLIQEVWMQEVVCR